MLLHILRFSESPVQTLAKFIVFDDHNLELAQGYMLELPDNSNERRISRINPGEYTCVKRFSEKYSNHFHILDVEGRDYILIHHGNYYTNTKGCILPGDGLADINKDGYNDVINSKKTMKLLNKILPDKFKVLITEQIECI